MILFENFSFLQPMAFESNKAEEILQREMEILDSLIYRSKNQHKSSLMFRKMTDIKRLLKANTIQKSRVLKSAIDLYIAASSNLSMGYFIPLSLCALGISARVFYLIQKFDVKSLN